MEQARPISADIKRINRSNIYQLLRKTGNLSKKTLQQRLDLSLPTINLHITELLEEALIRESGLVGNTGGRSATTYSIVPDVRTALGLDITRNHITCVAVDINGRVIHRVRIRCRFRREDAYFKRLGKLVQQVVAEGGINESRVLGVGIGVPGLIDEESQTVFYGKILDFTGATIAEFSRYIPYPSMFFNDANAAGYAETWDDSSLNNSFYMMLSNNVGGSVLIDGKPYSGENIRAGEIGHITIIPNGLACYCGQRGCVDSYCSATFLSKLTDGNLEMFFEALERGETAMVAQWKEYLYYLSLAVNNVRVLFDCPIILGGYVGAHMGSYIEDIRSIVMQRSTFDADAEYLRVCRYRTESIAAGAALHFIHDFIVNI